MTKPAQVARGIGVLLTLLLMGGACAASNDQAVESDPVPAQATTSLETADEPDAIDEPDASVEESAAPDDLAYAETDGAAEPDVADSETAAEPDVAEDQAPDEPSGPPLCTAIVPEYPEPGATGAVTYVLQGDWAQYAYGALYVIDASGESAFPAGEPSVRNGDSFEFVIDDSMQAADGTWTITTSINGEYVEPCDYRTVDLPTVTATGSGSTGY